jgi:hypothetical protein
VFTFDNDGNSFSFVAAAIDVAFEDVSCGDRSGECIKGEDVFAVGNIALLLSSEVSILNFQERVRTNTKADQDYL